MLHRWEHYRLVCFLSVFQVKALQGQIEKYEQELEQFELVKSDWQMEKQALEGVLKKLREELREKEGELSIIQARKVSTFLPLNSLFCLTNIEIKHFYDLAISVAEEYT